MARKAPKRWSQEVTEHSDALDLEKGVFTLKDPKKIRGVIKEELLQIKEKYADKRRTQLKADEGELDAEDLIAEEDVVITVSRAGYVKRQPIENFRRQGRGGKGIRGTNLKEEDVVRDVFTTTTHHWLLFFTSRGKVYRVKVHGVPESGRTARGTYAANLPGVGITADERVQAVIEGIRAEGNYAVIFDVAAMGGAMVAADRSLDITAQVIQRLTAAPGR